MAVPSSGQFVIIYERVGVRGKHKRRVPKIQWVFPQEVAVTLTGENQAEATVI